MKTISVAVSDEVYELAKQQATSTNGSLDALFTNLVKQSGIPSDSEIERLKRLEQATLDSIERFSAASRLGREGVYDREVFR